MIPVATAPTPRSAYVPPVRGKCPQHIAIADYLQTRTTSAGVGKKALDFAYAFKWSPFSFESPGFTWAGASKQPSRRIPPAKVPQLRA
jgi:hypothetical protein